MRELSKEELWDECALAFNMALEKASRAYHWRYERIHQAKKQIHQLIENQPEVTRKFVEKWFEKINYGIPVGSTIPITYLIDFLKEAGVKIKEEK